MFAGSGSGTGPAPRAGISVTARSVTQEHTSFTPDLLEQAETVGTGNLFRYGGARLRVRWRKAHWPNREAAGARRTAPLDDPAHWIARPSQLY
jgi:hypothetical protein